MAKIWIALLSFTLLAACAQVRPKVASGCVIPAYPMIVSGNEPQLLGASARPRPSFADVLDARLSARGRLLTDTAGGRKEILVLSGGSQHGAFGAGLFRGMARVPTYDAVTAVSTGALQSTFLFLANQPEPKRVYPAYMKPDPAIGAPGESNVKDLALAYAIANESDLMKVSSLGVAGAAFDGSVANFKPLRALLADMISDETLLEVAAEADKGRSLFVGVSNLDDGNGYALDLTELAKNGRDNGNIAAIRQCYIDALVASASVPPGVPPVTLRTSPDMQDHLYMDGGARFGVFFQQVRKLANDKYPAEVTLVVNGALYGGPWTEKGKPVDKWSVVSFGLRAVDMMENQVYRFSVDDLESWAIANGSLKMAFISNQGLKTLTQQPDAWTYNGMTCAQASADDDRKTHPQEFHPEYMRCLISYGQARGAGDPWNKEIPPKRP
jgi:predicted acylesterase/phospholipase RssA